MEVYKNLDWIETLEKIKSYTSSQKGKTLVSELSPKPTKELALQSAREILDAKSIITLDSRPSLESIDFYHNWYERLKRKGILKTQEFSEIRRFCFDVFNLQKTFNVNKNDWTEKVLSNLMDTSKIHSAIDQVITYEGEIRTDASETLYNLYNEKKSLERQIRTTLDKYVKTFAIEHMLQDRYVTNREGRWVLPIKSGKQHQFEGIIHDSSQTKQTVFMEPKEVIVINNRLKEVENDIEKEIQRLLSQLTHFIASHTNEIEISYNELLLADVKLAQGQFALKTDSNIFEFNDEVFILKGVRHPLLSFQNIKEVISNTIEFEKNKRIVILTGPNAGGKTVLLKAIGLTCHMARCGLLVPTDSDSQIPFFEKMFVTIGDTQSVGEHMSTFAAHLKTLTDAISAKGKNNLILVDEIAGSTDPEEGAAIARSFIEEYAQNDCYGVITSHLGPLKQIFPPESAIICGSMEYLDRPTYKLFMGIHGRSFALKTAKNVGVPENIVQRAMQYLSTGSREREEKLDEIDLYKEQILELQKKLDLETRIMESSKNKYKDLLRKFESEKQNFLQKAVERAEKKLDKIIEDFKANPNVVKVRAQFPEIIKSTGQVKGPQSVDEFIKIFPSGTTAYILSLGQDGIIQGVPNSKGEVAVLSKSMRLQVSWKDIRSSQSAAPAHPIHSQKLNLKSLPMDEAIIDVRGMSSDQAIEEIEKILDKALQEQIDRVKIIHGHGTEALKKSVRKYLSRSVYIQKWQAGTELASDDGITWAELS